MVTIRRRFADCRFGQLLIREINPGCGTPLLCLHATAYSSLSFLPLLAAYGDRRHVLAVDLPGYGDSDGPTRPVTVADYASAIGEVLPVGAVDVFGYHTGVVVGAELAIAQPERVRALTFMGVPYFRALDFEAWKARLAKPHRLLDGLDQFEERWQWLVTDRPVGMTLKRGFANFVDELKAWPNGFWAHQALFDYDCDAHSRWCSNRCVSSIPMVILLKHPESLRAFSRMRNVSSCRSCPAPCLKRRREDLRT